MTNKKYSSEHYNPVAIGIVNELKNLLDSKKFTENEFKYAALVKVLNKIEVIQEKKKRIEVLRDIQAYYEKELCQKKRDLMDKLEHNTAFYDRIKSEKSGGMFRYGMYDDLK